MSASILKSFTFVPQPKISSDPLIIKRERMVSRLEDQKKLLADPLFVRRVKRWERKESGEKVLIEKPIRTSKWWQPDQNGGYVMTVKVGSKRVEFEKGKAACFWHRHHRCKKATTPKSNQTFWSKKFSDNKARDSENYKLLHRLGWDILIVWQCETASGEYLDKITKHFVRRRAS